MSMKYRWRMSIKYKWSKKKVGVETQQDDQEYEVLEVQHEENQNSTMEAIQAQ